MALLTWLVGWALPLVLFLIIVMVMGHEFGHFITAKRAGLLVSDFFVGFGPVLWSTTRGETRYGVRALLLGGYVKVPGMTWGPPVEPALEARTYREASYPKKVLFASAGSLMHLVMALALAWASLAFIGAALEQPRRGPQLHAVAGTREERRPARGAARGRPDRRRRRQANDECLAARGPRAPARRASV